MRPDDREIDDEIRGHLALSVKERIERGEDPEAARLAALREFGYIPAARESIRRVWHSRWLDALAALVHDMRIGLRSLLRSPGLAITVVVTLALGIGANAAIFSVVRGVLLRPLVNRDESHLIYIRQSAPTAGRENMTFSVPEYRDLTGRVSAIATFSSFSTTDLTMSGLGGEPRIVKAGVVGGSFFDVMGLRPIFGRLLGPGDDGKDAAGAAVLTYRFWTALGSDPSVVGRTVRLGARMATIVGVLEPSVPYPADTEIIANLVTSPHHLSATMEDDRTHRMTEMFGRLTPGVTLEQARAELAAAHAAIVKDHPDAYPGGMNAQITVRLLRDQIASPARTILIVLLAAAAVVFVIACSNVANLILARSMRREGELAVRAALGASRGALRRTLLAESLVLCGAGAALGVLLARPFIAAVARYAARFSVRALDVTVDASVLWVGAGLALAAAVLLAYVPRLPEGIGVIIAAGRVTATTTRRLRIFATAQIALSFVLLAGAGMLLATLVSQQHAATGYDTRQVIAFDIPPAAAGVGGAKAVDFFKETMRRVTELPGVEAAAIGSIVPWRDAGLLGGPMPFTVEGYQPVNGEESPRAYMRLVSPKFFTVVGVQLRAGRDFSDEDRAGSDAVGIVSESVARRLFSDTDILHRRVRFTDPYLRKLSMRIVGVVADVDDEHVVPQAVMTVYIPVLQMQYGNRLFVRAAGDPYALVPGVTRVVRAIAPDQPVERAATLADVRAEVLSPERVNAFVFSGFAGVALMIAAVGVAGVLAFSVSARTREFGVRMAVGSSPARLLGRVLSEGVAIAAFGIAAGAAGGYGLARIAAVVFDQVEMPGAFPVIAAAAVLAAAAALASLMPAARAARVDVIQALRSE